MKRSIASGSSIILLSILACEIFFVVRAWAETQQAPGAAPNAPLTFTGGDASKAAGVSIKSPTQAPVAPQTSPTPAPTLSSVEPGLAIFYSGARRATLEPCGCHTKQQGGLQLEATLLDQYKDVPQLRLDAGEWGSLTAARLANEPLKMAFLLRGLDLLNYDAVNVSMMDVQLSAVWFSELKKDHPEALKRLVSSNVYTKDQPGQLAFDDIKIIKRKLTDGKEVRIAITGLAGLKSIYVASAEDKAANAQEVQTGSFIIKEPGAALKNVINKVASQADLFVVLYSGDLESALKLARANQQIDVLVTTAINNDANNGVVREGRTIILINPAPQAKEIRMVNLRQGAQVWEPKGSGERLVVSKEFALSPKLEGLIAEYRKATQQIAAEMPPNNAPQIYGGEDKCVMCHIEAHNQWRTTPHARAMATLVEHNQQFNPDCVRCHVTGYKNGNGFWHITDQHSQLYMSNVQCENCHGPAQQHVFDEQTMASGAEKWMMPDKFSELKKRLAAAMPKKQVPKEVCAQCHTSVTDPDFDYVKKVVQVNHKQPFKADPAKKPGMMHGMAPGDVHPIEKK